MPEVRLIDANALYEKVDESQAHNNHQGIAYSVHNAEHAHFKFMIHQAPTIDAKPVRDGRWIPVDGEPYAKCSYCGEKHYGCATPYCDMCGAYMRKDGADNG